MAVGTAIAIGLGALSAGASVMGGLAAKKEAEYAADIAEAQGRAQSLAIGAEAERLAEDQREVKAQQRVTAAQSGGGLSSGQNILVLAEQAQKMQMDQLELQRQQDLALSGAASKASLLKMRGKNAMTSGFLGAITSGAGTYSLAGGKFGGGGKTSSSSSAGSSGGGE